MSYSMIVLIPPEVREITVDHIARALQAYRPEIFRLQNILRIRISDWEMKIYLNRTSTVLIESKQIAKTIDHPQKERIATCNRRIELRGDADANGTYRQDFENILAILMKIKGTISMDFSY